MFIQNLCVRTCPDATPYIRLNLQEFCDTDNYKYIDEISTEGAKMCVKSC